MDQEASDVSARHRVNPVGNNGAVMDEWPGGNVLIDGGVKSYWLEGPRGLFTLAIVLCSAIGLAIKRLVRIDGRS